MHSRLMSNLLFIARGKESGQQGVVLNNLIKPIHVAALVMPG